MSDLAAALQVAIRVHAAQTDKQGQPYLLHVLRVVEAVSDEAKVVAALHDVIEDSILTLDSIAEDCDLAVPEGLALSLLTRREDETYTSYIARLADEGAANWSAQYAVLLARRVKLADLRDNLGRIPGELDLSEEGVARASRWESLRRRYRKAIETLEAVA